MSSARFEYLIKIVEEGEERLAEHLRQRTYKVNEIDDFLTLLTRGHNWDVLVRFAKLAVNKQKIAILLKENRHFETGIQAFLALEGDKAPDEKAILGFMTAWRGDLRETTCNLQKKEKILAMMTNCCTTFISINLRSSKITEFVLLAVLESQVLTPEKQMEYIQTLIELPEAYAPTQEKVGEYLVKCFTNRPFVEYVCKLKTSNAPTSQNISDLLLNLVKLPESARGFPEKVACWMFIIKIFEFTPEEKLSNKMVDDLLNILLTKEKALTKTNQITIMKVLLDAYPASEEGIRQILQTHFSDLDLVKCFYESKRNNPVSEAFVVFLNAVKAGNLAVVKYIYELGYLNHINLNDALKVIVRALPAQNNGIVDVAHYLLAVNSSVIDSKALFAVDHLNKTNQTFIIALALKAIQKDDELVLKYLLPVIDIDGTNMWSGLLALYSGAFEHKSENCLSLLFKELAPYSPDERMDILKLTVAFKRDKIALKLLEAHPMLQTRITELLSYGLKTNKEVNYLLPYIQSISQQAMDDLLIMAVNLYSPALIKPLCMAENKPSHQGINQAFTRMILEQRLSMAADLCALHKASYITLESPLSFNAHDSQLEQVKSGLAQMHSRGKTKYDFYIVETLRSIDENLFPKKVKMVKQIGLFDHSSYMDGVKHFLEEYKLSSRASCEAKTLFSNLNTIFRADNPEKEKDIKIAIGEFLQEILKRELHARDSIIKVLENYHLLTTEHKQMFTYACLDSRYISKPVKDMDFSTRLECFIFWHDKTVLHTQASAEALLVYLLEEGHSEREKFDSIKAFGQKVENTATSKVHELLQHYDLFNDDLMLKAEDWMSMK